MWGDVNHDGRVDFSDVSLIVDAFSGNFAQVTLYAADLHDCVPSRAINFSDISRDVDAFQGSAYPCPNPCP